MSDAAYQQSICVTYICCIYKHYYRKFRDITLTGKDKKAEIIYLKVNKIFEVVPLGKFFFSRGPNYIDSCVGHVPDSEAETTAAQSHGVLESSRTGGWRIRREEETASASSRMSEQKLVQALLSTQQEKE